MSGPGDRPHHHAGSKHQRPGAAGSFSEHTEISPIAEGETEGNEEGETQVDGEQPARETDTPAEVEEKQQEPEKEEEPRRNIPKVSSLPLGITGSVTSRDE